MKKIMGVMARISYIVIGSFLGLYVAFAIQTKNPTTQEPFAYLQGCTLGQARLVQNHMAVGVDPAFCLDQSKVFSDTLESVDTQMKLILEEKAKKKETILR